MHIYISPGCRQARSSPLSHLKRWLCPPWPCRRYSNSSSTLGRNKIRAITPCPRSIYCICCTFILKLDLQSFKSLSNVCGGGIIVERIARVHTYVLHGRTAVQGQTCIRYSLLFTTIVDSIEWRKRRDKNKTDVVKNCMYGIYRGYPKRPFRKRCLLASTISLQVPNNKRP